MHSVLLVTAAFLAAAVEMVEALTIVLAVGVTRGWRSAGWGVAAAAASLAVLVVGFGPALANTRAGWKPFMKASSKAVWSAEA